VDEGTLTLVSLLAKFLSRFSAFRGSDNPYYGIRIPKGFRRLWQLIEFISAIPIVLIRFVLPNMLGFLVIAERYLPDLVAWISLRVVVLDEADRMLDMGFIDDISTILFFAKNRKQTLLFSATMPYEVINLSRKYMKNPITVKISRDELIAKHIGQYYVETIPENKLKVLKRILNEHRGENLGLLCNKKENKSYRLET